MQVQRAAHAIVSILSLALCLFLAAAGSVAAAPNDQSNPAIANDARVAGDRERTRFIADLSRKVDVRVFALGNPYRVIVDAPDVNFQMPDGVGKEKRGLVTAYRYGLFAPGKARIVIDVSGPFLIDKAFVLEPRDDQPARLVIDLVPTDEKTFLAKLKEAKPPPELDEMPVTAPKALARPADAKPVVVLDPGHGGIDPGTSSTTGITEKEVVLTFARALKSKLDASGRYEVYLTRDSDTFLPLRERVEVAQKKGASLFLSIHADYFPNKTEKPTGATVYTLSEEASDEEARALAAKENFSDALAGIELPSDSDEVLANILIDLAQRETQNRSVVFARSIVGELASKGTLHTRKLRSAGFRVLKAPDVPSVLLELGFLSNPDDEKRLTSETWRERTADAVADSIDAYFAKRLARNPY
jgi:N-acetylmuramoyl-L-alanine amidase